MPSPLAHSLLGLASARLVNQKPRYTALLLAVLLFSALAPDLDFLPGFLIGDPNRFHHGPSHSLTAAVLYALALCWPAQYLNLFTARTTAFMTLFTVYTSHLVADLLTEDGAAPFGIPLFWPLTSEYYISPLSIFMKIEHGPSAGDNVSVLDSIFSWANLFAMSMELIITLPILYWVWRRSRKFNPSANP